MSLERSVHRRIRRAGEVGRRASQTAVERGGVEMEGNKGRRPSYLRVSSCAERVLAVVVCCGDGNAGMLAACCVQVVCVCVCE